jgi:hypothetical protein
MEILSIKKFFLQSMQTFENLVSEPQSKESYQTTGGDSSGQATAAPSGGGRKLRKHRK